MIVAYIDAGTGAMLLQWIIALVIGAGVFFRGTIVGFLRKWFGRKTPDKSATDDCKSHEDTEKTK